MDLEGMRVQTEFDPAIRALVGERLGASNTERSPVMRALRGEHDKEIPLDLYVFDGEELVAGLTGDTWASWLAIENLWVHADRRGSGLGSQLLAEAERRARERGCLGARLETWEFQARPFYERHGYTVYGVLEDYPPGATEYHLAKRLV
jgi:GNAT superfamily N-acetyltransferase